jgi:hypothetical protein
MDFESESASIKAQLICYMILLILFIFIETNLDLSDHLSLSCRDIAPIFPESPVSEHWMVLAF